MLSRIHLKRRCQIKELNDIDVVYDSYIFSDVVKSIEISYLALAVPCFVNLAKLRLKQRCQEYILSDVVKSKH